MIINPLMAYAVGHDLINPHDLELPMIPADAPEIGTTWQHYKNGHVYKVLGFVLDSETLVWKVSYQRVEGGIIWARPVPMWNDLIVSTQGRVPRFKRMPWSDA